MRFYVAKSASDERKKRARMRVLLDFLSNAFIWPETYAKKNWDDLVHFKFLRARKRADERARAHFCARFIDLKLTGRILILFMINMNEKLLFRYEDMIIRLILTKWRLDDVTMILSL